MPILITEDRAVKVTGGHYLGLGKMEPTVTSTTAGEGAGAFFWILSPWRSRLIRPEERAKLHPWRSGSALYGQAENRAIISQRENQSCWAM